MSSERPSCPPRARNDYSTTARISYDQAGATARGYPSDGGIILLPLDVVLATHLGLLPRLPEDNEPKRYPDQAQEDDFCRRLRLAGGKWWSSEDDMMRKIIGFEEPSEEEKRVLFVGWPDGGKKGVWVLSLEDESKKPKDLGKLNLCVTMDERCGVLRGWGAEYFEDPKQVPELEDLI
ncbi:MAG: hypothetical protein M1831_004100 [Alyxoria varia]|nr:MAG: hypothetical protein M1831_004100 [Alyxoria varia]